MTVQRLTLWNSFSLFVVLIAVHSTLGAAISGHAQRGVAPNDPIGNARITLFDPTLAFFRETRTNGAGDYAIANVPAGTYQIGCAALRFRYLVSSLTVGAADVTRDFAMYDETNPGQWNIIGTTAPEFLDATDIGILLPDGRVMYCHDTTDPVIFDPVTGTRTYPSGSPSEQGCMNGSLLEDGKVIMIGGQNGADPGNFTQAVRWVKTYSPQADQWTLLPDLVHPTGRWYTGLARLADGSFLIMGGGTCCSAARTETCERFNLTTQTWSDTGSLMNPTEFPPSALLYTGEVLATWSPPQLYNPTTGQWRLTGDFNQTNRGFPGHSDHSTVVLEDGRVLAIGVRGPQSPTLTMGEIYDPANETWSLTSNPGLIRFQSEVVQLPDGRVLVAGGETSANPPPVPDTLGVVKWTDLYDPPTNTWRRVADMNEFREYHAVTLLVPDGRVLTTGGTRIQFQIGPTSQNVEAFSPPYLFRGVRPSITSLSSTTLARGSTFSMQIAPQTQLTSIVLMGIQSTTHWVDGGIPRRLPLAVQQSGSTVTATLPTGPNILPLGRYMIFAMVDDIPSAGVIVQIVNSGPVPAISTWGLATVMLLLAAVGRRITLRRTRP